MHNKYMAAPGQVVEVEPVNIVKHKFYIGEEVYFMANNTIKRSTIKRVDIQIHVYGDNEKTDITYIIANDNESSYEARLFATPEELTANLISKLKE